MDARRIGSVREKNNIHWDKFLEVVLMRLSKRMLGAAMITMAVLSACTTAVPLSRSEQTRLAVEKEYGKVGPRSNPEAFERNGRDGKGFAMFRLYSEKPLPNRFGQNVPERFDNALVVDFGVDMKMEGRFPLYRIGIEPKKIPQDRVDLWPSHVLLEADMPGGTSRRLATRLPESRIPGPDGMIWSDWTYCADCFGLEDIRDAGIEDAEKALGLISDASAAAERLNGVMSPYQGQVRFTMTPGVGILLGEAAHDMAVTASDVIAAEQMRILEMEKARGAYWALRGYFGASGSPERAVLRYCGIYEPNRDETDVLTEKARSAAYADCGIGVIENFDRIRREEELAAFAEYEMQLARKAGIPQDMRMKVPDLDEEIVAAYGLLDTARDRFAGFAMAHGDFAAPAAPAWAPEAETMIQDEELAAEATGEAAGERETKTEPVLPQPAGQGIYYVARLLPEGANMERGPGTERCLAGMECETGAIIALISADEYCGEEGGTTKTVPGWGLVVQRYQPRTREQEEMILAGDGESRVHVVAESDAGALSEGLEAMRGLTDQDGSQVFFTSYQAFYEVNTGQKGCQDQWRDAGKAKVTRNPAEALQD